MQTIKYVKIGSLKVHPNNPRVIKNEQFKKLCESIKEDPEYFEARPCLVNKKGIIFAGNQRYKAAQELGLKQVPVIVMDNPALEAKRMLRDNMSAGEWDFDMLTNSFDQEMLTAVGFDMSSLPDPISSVVDGQDDVPKARKTNIKVGDSFTLGEHVLVCGDSTDRNVVAIAAGGGVHMAFTDPPWNVALGLDSVPSHRKRKAMQNDSLGKDFPAFLLKVASCLQEFVKGDLYCVMGCGEWPAVHAALTGAKFHWSSSIIWVKDSFVMGRHNYHTRFEPIWYGWQKTSSYRGDRKQDDVWEFSRPNKSPEHPTMKPVELVENAIHNSSVKGDTVLDLFGGSGTTLIACEKTARRCRMIELEPGYCQVIVDRWEKFTGKKAKKI